MQTTDGKSSFFDNEIFAIHLDTENKSIKLVAEEIAMYVGLNLNPPKWHPILRPWQRIIVQIRHLRFDKK